MVKAIKNAWTLAVNLGWVAVLGVFVVPRFLDHNTTPLRASTPATVVRDAAPPVALEVKAPEVKQLKPQAPPEQLRHEPEAVVQEQPVQKLDNRPVLRLMTDAEVQEELLKRKSKEDQEWERERQRLRLDRQDWIKPPEDLPPTFAGSPAVICEGGTCRLDPRYKYDATEPRLGPEPVIYFPQPPLPKGLPPGETPRSARAREKNKELRFQLNQFKGRLKWTPKVRMYLDLTEMGPCPWNTEKVFDQNWELKWRLRQIGLLAQGYETEGNKIPKRPDGKEGYVGILPQTLQ